MDFTRTAGGVRFFTKVEESLDQMAKALNRRADAQHPSVTTRPGCDFQSIALADVSTRHITQLDWQMANAPGECPCRVAVGQAGPIFCVPQFVDERGVDRLIGKDFSEEFVRALRAARRAGFQWVRFSEKSSTVDSLPIVE